MDGPVGEVAEYVGVSSVHKSINCCKLDYFSFQKELFGTYSMDCELTLTLPRTGILEEALESFGTDSTYFSILNERL